MSERTIKKRKEKKNSKCNKRYCFGIKTIALGLINTSIGQLFLHILAWVTGDTCKQKRA